MGTAWGCPQESFDFGYDIQGAVERSEKLYGDGIPMYQVVSGSMEPEYEVGDLLIRNSTVPFHDIEKGDVVLFQNPTDMERTTVHRAVHYNGTHWITKGDANPHPRSFDVVGPDNYIGVVQGHYERVGDAVPDWVGVVARNMHVLEFVELADCQYHLDANVPWVILNLGDSAYMVDGRVDPIISHILLWFAIMM